MSEAKIHFIILETDHRQPDVDQILDAMEVYSTEAPDTVASTAHMIDETHQSTGLELMNIYDEPKPHHDLLEAAEKMRKAVEARFPEASRDRLSRLFAGIAINGALEIE